ncbi:hypothetical protein, partial [Enterococcus faecium]
MKSQNIEKLSKEVKRDSLLLADKVIARKEFEDKYADWQNAVHEMQIKIKDQLSQWNNELQRIT